MFPGHATRLDDVGYYDDGEIDGMRFHGVNKNYERFCDVGHHTCKRRLTVHCICNLRYNTPKKNIVYLPQWVKL